MSKSVLDASALLALLKEEPGSEQVIEAITEGAAISTVNFSEVVAKLNEAGMPDEAIHESLDSLGLEIVGFDTELAYLPSLLRPLTKQPRLPLSPQPSLPLP